MSILIQALQFFASLSLLVLIHEFGHYITARIFKIRVDAFYIFFNPWFSIYKRKVGDTIYGIGWLPLGGYVSLNGMVDETIDSDKIEQLKEEPKPWEFRSKPAWQRLIVMLAGVVMNVIMAMVIYTGMLCAWGESYYHNDDMKYGYIYNEEAHAFGFEDGDRILSIDNNTIGNVSEINQRLLIVDHDLEVDILRGTDSLTLTLPLTELVAMRERGTYQGFISERVPMVVKSVATEEAMNAGLEVDDHIIAIDGNEVKDYLSAQPLLQERRGVTTELTVVRNACDTLQIVAPVSEDAKLGIQIPVTMPRYREYSFWEAIPAGIKMTGREIASYWNQLKMIVNPDTKLYKEVGGFLAIGSVFPDEWNWPRFWHITALISIMLAVMNLLPIPGLDGGHALFTLWEIITRRKPSEKFLVVMQWIGLAILFALLIYANGNDIFKLFK